MEEERMPMVSNTNGATDVGGPSSDNQSLKAAGGGRGGAQKRGKSCNGCLYYSSALKSNSRSPICVGITRSIPHGPNCYVRKSELPAIKEGRSLAYFKYGCAGYSVYTDGKNSGNVQETQRDLPLCAGFEFLLDREVTTAADSGPAHVQNKDGHAIPQPRTHKPAHSVGEDFLSRFTRNASLVAKGVAKNAHKVGNHMKESLEDLYPYRRRPK